MAPAIRLETWGPGDFELLRGLLGDPAMMTHLGGPETEEQLVKRQARYEGLPDALRIVLADTGEPAGWVGFWDREWQGESVVEMGWSVLPAFQGRGIAKAATAAAIERIRAQRPGASVHAFPSVDNGPSNGVCRALGFRLAGTHEGEYPPGHPMTTNDWVLELAQAP